MNKIIIGETRVNNNGNTFIIESKEYQKSNNKHTYYNIRFLDSGYIDSVRGDSIIAGHVKDKLSISYCNIGIIGYIDTKTHYQEYKIWKNMISRCYDIKDKSYIYYGAKGVSVCPRWWRFEWFVHDIPYIKGFNKKLFDSGLLRLDKDINCRLNNKMYSLFTTQWVSDLQNQKQRAYDYNLKNKKYAIFPDGHKELITHVGDFCKEHNLHRQNVNLCLTGKQKSTKGFTFLKE